MSHSHNLDAQRRLCGRAVPSSANTGRSHAGFSLVEVTLAVAIASFAIITLLGLIPQGLEMSRKTGLITTNSYIVEQIVRDLESTKFNLITGGNDERKYFNDQGQEVDQDSGDVVYVASLDFTQTAALPLAETTQPYLKRVVVKVANSSNLEFKFEDTNRLSYTVFNHLIAKTR